MQYILSHVSRKTIILVVFLPILFINVKNSHNWGGDFAQYINQAKCIAEGKSQSETGYIYNELNPYLGPPAYPVGFPMLLAPVYYFFGNNILAFSYLISVVLFILSLLLVKLYRNYFPYFLSVVITIAFIYNPWVIRFKASVLSDIPFTLFIILPVWFYLSHPFKEKLLVKNSIILGMIISFSMLIKSMGIVILLGLLIDYIILFITNRRKNRKNEVMIFYNTGIVVLTIALSYTLVTYIIFPSGTEQYSFFPKLFQLKNIGVTLKQSLHYYPELIRNFFSDNVIISSLTLVLFLTGFIRKVFSRIDIIDYIFILYVAVLFIFPPFQGFRYLLPVYPFVILYIIYGIQYSKLNVKIMKIYIPVILAVLLFFLYYDGISSVIKSQKVTYAGPQSNYSKEAFEFIRDHTDDDAVFAFIKPRVLALYTCRPSIGFGIVDNIEYNERMFSEAGVDYIMTVKDISNPVIQEYIERYINRLLLIWENDRIKIYKIRQTD